MVFNMDGLVMQCDFALHDRHQLLMCGFLDHAKAKVKAVGANIGHTTLNFEYEYYATFSERGWSVDYASISMGRDTFYYGLAVNKVVGTDYLVTTPASREADLYDFLMKHYKLPLLQSWMIPLLNAGIENELIRKVSSEDWLIHSEKRSFPLHGRDVPLKDLIFYNFSAMDEKAFEELVSDCLKQGIIRITNKYIPELSFENFDDYISKYGSSLISNIDNLLHPLVPLKGQVDTVALKHKRLFPQQAACVNGIAAARNQGLKYAIMNEGMGVGKTCQSISAIEAYFVQKWLDQHPGMTAKDAYSNPDNIHYRVCVIAPGQLVKKWVAEIEEEVPYAKATILNDFSQIVDMQRKGKARNGKEFFVASKDFLKLGSLYAPIPEKVGRKKICAEICSSCKKERDLIIYKPKAGQAVCPSCGGKRFEKFNPYYLPEKEGMLCPHCNELLLDIKNPVKQFPLDEDAVDYVLQPSSFAKMHSGNLQCYHCNAPLWGVNCKPIDNGHGEKRHKSKWHKISFAKNRRKKTTETAYVLNGYEDEYTYLRGITDYTELPEFGPRKVAPAQFIKKYMKGFFDFLILDECHKFEGAGTAQATAAHALIQASDFTLGLTGTIANGSAGSLFYLLFMLDSRRMISNGYTWSTASYMEFCHKYGAVESLYEYTSFGSENAIYNASSRGRQLSSPRVKPGISPLLFTDFLLDRCVFLDITDLSQYLPPLYEKVCTVPMSSDISYSFRKTVSALKEAVHGKDGRSALTELLQFEMSYPDKPYGRENIMSGFTDGEIIASVENHEEYTSLDSLLPKEEKLVEIIRQELSEGRNAFVFASFTGNAETNVTERLKAVIERHCNLKGHVQILQASSPAPIDREEWIKKKAYEGIKVFIANPKTVETGLDFCFKYKGGNYNFPTLIFYQIGMEMAVIWQASRRAYRLIQREECRNYYLAYEETLQTAMLELMAQKQVATSAIQGKFSSEGLAAMAKGVDTRTKLAEALAKNDMSNRETLSNMFDALNIVNNSDSTDYGDYIPPKTFYELLGKEEEDIGEDVFSYAAMLENTVSKVAEPADRTSSNKPLPNIEYGLFSGGFLDLFASTDDGTSIVFNSNIVEPAKKTTKKRKSIPENQDNIFDLFGIA